jgi:PAS domain S-box-containing protein
MKQTNKTIRNISIAKVLFPTLLTIVLLITAIFIVVIPQFENIIMDRKREMIRELTNSTISMIERWHSLEREGKLSKIEAQNFAMQFVKNIRYGEDQKDYFWITDFVPRMIVHPYRPELEGESLENFEDSHGKTLFVEMVQVVQKNGEGFVDYMWQWKDDSLKVVPKLSYVKKFAPWNWVVGTGIYIEDVKEEISNLERNIISISVIITALSSILLLYIAYQNLKSERLRKLAEDELKESRERYRMLVEASSEGLIMILDNGQIFLNKTFYDMLDYDDQSVKVNLKEVFTSLPESKVFDFNSLRRIDSSEGFNEKIETQLVTKNGDLKDVLLDLSTITFMNNNGVVITVKDVSTNKEIKEALDYTKEKYLALTNQISIGVFRASADKKLLITEVNPAMINILETESESNLINKSLLDYFIDKEEINSVIDELFNSGMIKNKIVRLRKTNGLTITTSLSAVWVKSNNNQLEYIDGIIEDITEQQRTDKEREKIISDLQRSVTVLSQKITPYIKTLPVCKYNSLVSEISKVLTESKCSAVLVEGFEKEEMGIITDHDLRERVIASGKSMETPAYSIMTSPIASIKSTATIYDALAKMREKQIRHLIVKGPENNTMGVIDIDDLFEVSFSNFLFFIKEIEAANDIKMLADYRNNLINLITKMIPNGVDIKSITKLISLIADAIIKKVINKSIQQLGQPPCKFAFITMGSEGREEQTLATDQDNAIIFEDVPEEGLNEIQSYFQKLGEMISNDLNSAGYMFCKGGIMAKNIKWCQPIGVWKKYFTNWITTSAPQDLLEIKIFFDFRFVFGEEKLTLSLREHINSVTKNYNSFFVFMAENLIRTELPDSTLKLKLPFDIKLLMIPVIDFARLYSLKLGLTTNNTSDRLEFICEKGVISETLFNNIAYSYNTLMNIRFNHQSEKHISSKTIDNVINPQSLSEVELVIIKKYFDVLKEMKDKINLDFKGTLVR